MPTSRDGQPLRRRVLTDLRDDAAPHARPVLHVAVATAAGTVAAFAFQVISARSVGPQDFGLLAAFLGIINVAVVASSALQNAVAVRTAEIAAGSESRSISARRRPSDATILGLGGAIAVAVATPVLAPILGATPSVVLLAGACLPLCFWLAEAVGVLQGVGGAERAMWWTTASMLIRVALALVAAAVGLGIGGLLAAVLGGTAIAAVGAGRPARRIPHPGRGLFTASGTTILSLSLLSAWLVNADVVVLRATAPEAAAGMFASAAVLVKSAFLLPATMSIYLLPRFVRNIDNGRLVRLGERVTIALTVLCGLVLAGVFWLAGGAVIRIIYGESFAESADVLVALSLAYLPWITAQTVLIRLTAQASFPAVAVLAAAAAVQITGFTIAAGDITTLIWVQAAIGSGVLAALVVLVRRLNGRSTGSRHAGPKRRAAHLDKEAAS